MHQNPHCITDTAANEHQGTSLYVYHRIARLNVQLYNHGRTEDVCLPQTGFMFIDNVTVQEPGVAK